MQSKSAVLAVLDALVAGASLTLRYTAVLFVRFHPLGKRYLGRVYWSAAVFAAAFVVQLFLLRRGVKRTRRPGLGVLLAVYDRARPWLTALGVLINACCLAAVLDFLYRGHVLHPSTQLSFSRVGHVDSTTARIVVRAPISDYVEITVTSGQAAAAAAVHKQQMVQLDPQRDYAATFLLQGLTPNTSYTYTTNASHAGWFHTAAPPQAAPRRWSLASTSCIKPFYPYAPLDHGLRIRGLEHLDGYLAHRPVDLVLFLGDFIYIDLPIALGWDAQAYYTAYRQVYASPSWSPRLRATPWLHLYDDHEIINDWASNETGLYSTAMQPFWSYQGHANPPSEFGAGETYYVFRHGGVAFFVLDTRRYRSENTVADGPDKTMLGAAQLAALLRWLGAETEWKVVVSSVPFTRNWRGPDSADSWSGYLWEREVILQAMKQNGGAVILSGDRHEHATTEFPAKAPGEVSVIEFSTSPLNQFYEPFDRFHRQIEETDISIYSHPWGTSKFGVVSFDTSDAERLLVHYELVVDGSRVWEYDWTQRRT